MRDLKRFELILQNEIASFDGNAFREIALVLELGKKRKAGIKVDESFYENFVPKEFIHHPILDDEEEALAKLVVKHFGRFTDNKSAISMMGEFRPELVLSGFLKGIMDVKTYDLPIAEQITYSLNKLLAVGDNGVFSMNVAQVVEAENLIGFIDSLSAMAHLNKIREELDNIKMKVRSRSP